MKVSELINCLSALPAEYRVVIGTKTEYRDIDYTETDYTSEVVSLWTEEDTP